MRSLSDPFFRSSNESMVLGESLDEVVGVALTISATGRATEDDEDDNVSDLADREAVRPRKTLARPPGRDESGVGCSSPVGGDMCSGHDVSKLEGQGTGPGFSHV